MAKYRQFYDEEEDEDVDFTVFIIHGRSPEIHKVERFIKDDLNFNVIILKDSFSGKNIINKFKDVIWDKACCAVAIMSPDDKLDNGNFRTRQNVIYELGYCSGVFDGYYEEDDEGDVEQDPVIMIKERSIDMRDLSDLLGVEYMEYTEGGIEIVFNNLRKALNTLYEELGGEDDED